MSSTRSGVGAWLLRLLLVALLLTGTVPGTPSASAQPFSERPAAVELTEAEADSILSTIDGLRIDLWECRELAAQDSLFYEERLALTKQAYEHMLEAYREERPNWLERVLKQPVVWLGIGMWIGVQAR